MQLATLPNGLLKRKLFFQSRSPNNQRSTRVTHPPPSPALPPPAFHLPLHQLPLHFKCTCHASQTSYRSDNRATHRWVNLTCDRQQDGMMRNRCDTANYGHCQHLDTSSPHEGHQRSPRLRHTGPSGQDLAEESRKRKVPNKDVPLSLKNFNLTVSGMRDVPNSSKSDEMMSCSERQG